MEELDVYRIVARQKAITDELIRLQANISKDGPGRKKREYAEKRLELLEALWSEFFKNHEEIKEIVKKDTPYIQSNTIEKVQQIYEKTRQDLLFIAKERRLEEQAGEESSDKAIAVGGQAEATTGTKPKSKAEENPTPTLRSKQPEPTKDDNSSEIIRCLRRKKIIEQSLKRLLNSVQESSSETWSSAFCRIKIDRLHNSWSQMEELHQQIAEMMEGPVEEGLDAGNYFDLEDRIQDCLLALTTKMEGDRFKCSTGQSNKLKPILNLPNITLPKFDGDYLKWRQYSDLFNELVHKQEIANCQKLFYLKTTLTGKAEKLIRHFTTSDANYSAAWKVITERYENPRLLVTALINKFMAQPTIQNEGPTQIKAMHDTTLECLLSLQNLNIDTANWDPLLMNILLKKLDRNTLTIWEQSLKQPKELPILSDFLVFLETRFQSLEAISSRPYKLDEPKRQKKFILAATSERKCMVCNQEDHPMFKCPKFNNMQVKERLHQIKLLKRCFNCLRFGHQSSDCKSGHCTKCNKFHHTLLHISTQETGQQGGGAAKELNPSTSSAVGNSRPSNKTTLAAFSNTKEAYVFLSTVKVQLEGQNGTSVYCRAILDSGSQVNLITEKMIRKLDMPLSLQHMRIQGIGQIKRDSHRRANVCLKSRVTNFNTRLEATVLPQIVSSQPSQAFDISNWKIPGNIQLADPHFHKPNRIDLLIGAEYFHQLLCVGQIKLGEHLPLLQNTLLGWVVTGKTYGKQSLMTKTCGVYAEDKPLEKAISKFWETEELSSSTSKRTIAEEKCEEYFNQTITRTDSGRFVVSLPFSDEPDKLGSSSDVALSRFYAIERKLDRDPLLKNQYSMFMNEYLELGHMVETNHKAMPTPHYFLPHHCVLKPESNTTRLRVVFDASAKTSSNISLNNIMYTGPSIQDDLFTILLRFRIPRFVIQKMYRQIRIREEDQVFQLIWWRADSTKPLKCYKLCTVTYGTNSAPYLATKCLQVLANEYKAKYPLGAEVLLRDFYVDDVMTGADSIVEAKLIQSQLSSLLREGGLRLKKWCSNNQQLLENVPLEDQEIPLTDEINEGAVKTLGLTWRPRSDVFCIKTNYTASKRCTKRSVASDIARLFDPLGIVAPVITTAKLILQELWELKYDWDAALPEEIHTRWNKYYQGLRELNKFQIPRHIYGHHVASSIQVHTFADASEKAYGAATYIRSITKDGTIIVRLLCSKSRVAPTTKTASGMRSMTIPRLELCAALLAAELSKRVKIDLKIDNASSLLWSDSQIVLSWINSNAESFDFRWTSNC